MKRPLEFPCKDPRRTVIKQCYLELLEVACFEEKAR